MQENGEAAHLSVLKRSDGAFLFVVGSKNTHMIVRSIEDIEQMLLDDKKAAEVYKVAATMGIALLQMLDRMDPPKRLFLCEWLWQTRLTASFEMLCPDHQHVQLLTMEENTPVFYGLSFPALEPPLGAEICVNPVLGNKLMRHCGVRCVDYRVVQCRKREFKAALDEIKRGYGYEGSVNLYLDSDACVIGLEKYKTAWYVCLRAIREKAKSCMARVYAKKNSTDPRSALDEVLVSLRKRFVGIQSYLELSQDVNDQYLRLGERFLTFLCEEKVSGDPTELKAQVANMFPLVWKEFLDHTQLSDRIQE